MTGHTLKPSGGLLTAHLTAAWGTVCPVTFSHPVPRGASFTALGTGSALDWWYTPATLPRVLVALQAYILAEELLKSHIGLDAQCCHLSHQRGPDPASILGTHTAHPVVEGACEVVQRHELETLFRPLFIELDEHLVTADANDAVYLDAST